MNKKGFTLIEVLAVVTILAIISLIAAPLVQKAINNGRESSDKVSASKYIEAVKLALTNRELDGYKYYSSCSIIDKVLMCDGDELIIDAKGTFPKEADIYLEKTDVMSAVLKFNTDKYILYTGDDLFFELDDKSNILTVTFDPSGGELFQNKKQVTKDFKYGYLPYPTKDGYEFKGWSITGTTGYITPNTKVTKNSNHTLMAVWQEIN